MRFRRAQRARNVATLDKCMGEPEIRSGIDAALCTFGEESPGPSVDEEDWERNQQNEHRMKSSSEWKEAAEEALHGQMRHPGQSLSRRHTVRT